MFDYYDKNHDEYLDSVEMDDVEHHDYLQSVLETTSCHMRDFIILQDTDDDDRLSLAELNTAMGQQYNVMYCQLEMRLYWEFPWVPWGPWDSDGNGNR